MRSAPASTSDPRARPGEDHLLVRHRRAMQRASWPRPWPTRPSRPALPVRGRLPQHPRLGRPPASPARLSGQRQPAPAPRPAGGHRQAAAAELAVTPADRAGHALHGRDAHRRAGRHRRPPTLKHLRRRHTGFTLDLLGEACLSDAEADEYARRLHDLLDYLPAKVAVGATTAWSTSRRTAPIRESTSA